MNKKVEYICRICGFEDSEPFWLETGGPSYQICVCCSGESGYNDLKQTAIERKRKEWIERGYTWFDEKEKPENWSLEEQIERIPKKYGGF